MTDYREADFSRLKTVPVAKRANKVDPSLLAHPPRASDRSFAAFLDALPSILAAQDLRYVVDQIVAAADKRAVVVMLGGHVIKVGLGPLLIALMRQRAVTVVAMNGSAAIHDFELAAYGGTSEDVAAGLGDGTFGMAEETGREMNAALAHGAKTQQGAGEALAEYLRTRKDLPGRDDPCGCAGTRRAPLPRPVVSWRRAPAPRSSRVPSLLPCRTCRRPGPPRHLRSCRRTRPARSHGWRRCRSSRRP